MLWIIGANLQVFTFRFKFFSLVYYRHQTCGDKTIRSVYYHHEEILGEYFTFLVTIILILQLRQETILLNDFF